jgi:fermentation-respiration switch protein FrsA (DUF1100 family)
VLSIAVVVIAVLLFAIWAGQRRLIYFPFGGSPTPADYGLPQAQAVTVPTSDGVSLGAWFVPASAPATNITVIVFNGNAGHRGHRAPLGRALAARGIASLLLDYRGYGGNSGSPSERGLMLDAQAARTWLDARPDVDRTRVVYFGESLGSGVAVQLSASRPPRALILRSPYTSLVDLGRRHYPWLPVSLLLRDRFASIDVIPRVRVPLLVIAGERDTIIPASNSERLFAAANEPKHLEVIDGADHNDLPLLAGAQMIDAIVRFLTSER